MNKNLSSEAKLNKKSERVSVLIKDVVRDYQLYIMIIPVLLYYFIFMYKPMYGLQIAFKDYNVYRGIAASQWIGFAHFIDFFSGPFFWRTLRNTVYLSVYGIIFNMPLTIILALLFNELSSGPFKKLIQTVTYLPHFISTVIVVGLVVNFLAPSTGIINIIIDKLGGEKIYFLTKPEYFRTIFTSMNIWKDIGFGTIIYMAALAGIDSQLYEAAVIDGASRIKQIRHVTIPGILPTIVLLLILNIGKILSVSFEAIILLYQPATYETADVISSYVYRSGLSEGRYDLATAVGLFNSVVALILTVCANYISKKMSEISLW